MRSDTVAGHLFSKCTNIVAERLHSCWMRMDQGRKDIGVTQTYKMHCFNNFGVSIYYRMKLFLLNLLKVINVPAQQRIVKVHVKIKC